MKNYLLLLMLLVFTGCAHNVAFKSPDIYKHEKVLPVKMAFYMDSSVKSKVYSERSFMSGIANSWNVPIGSVVHEYGVAYLQAGVAEFKEIQAPDEGGSYDLVVTITDIVFNMSGQAAHCDLTVDIKDRTGNPEVKKYHADGPSGMGRVLAAGVFAQKSAIRQSTHVAMENIYKGLMGDLRKKQQGF